MSELVRFGVSLEEDLLKEFDRLIERENYTNRSEAIRDLLRNKIVNRKVLKGDSIWGTITLVYDHHQRDLVNRLIDIQHDHGENIVSSQHIHIDHDNCMEIIVVKGRPDKLADLANRLRSAKGVKHGQLTPAVAE